MIILVVLGLFIVAVVVVGILTGSGKILFLGSSEVGEGQEKESVSGFVPEEQAQIPVFTPEVPEDAQLSEPKSEAPASQNSESKFGIYTLEASKSGFSPSTITVKSGDTVQIRMRALDGNYDFSLPYLGLYRRVNQGEEGNITFDAINSGTFAFMCRDHCPVGKKIQGELIVLP